MASVPLDDGGGALSAGALAGAGALGVSTALDEGASEEGRPSVVDAVSDIQVHRSCWDQEALWLFCGAVSSVWTHAKDTTQDASQRTDDR